MIENIQKTYIHKERETKAEQTDIDKDNRTAINHARPGQLHRHTDIQIYREARRSMYSYSYSTVVSELCDTNC